MVRVIAPKKENVCPACKEPIPFHTEEDAEDCAYDLGYSRNDEGAH